MSGETALRVDGLKTYIYSNRRCNKAVDGVSFTVKRGRTLCIVGESGCGKSVTASAIMQLLPSLSRIEEGEITYFAEDGAIRIDGLARNGKQMRDIRGGEIAMIFQDPMTALNPVYTIGFQIAENLIYHTKMSGKAVAARCVELLRDMGIPLPEKRVGEYPHNFSGGMRQRAMIAMAMACNPKILIADEPTTALDVTIQAQILDLLRDLQRDRGMALVLITHDMGVIAEMAHRVQVMYAGQQVEVRDAERLFDEPRHPYTAALLDALPERGVGHARLPTIPGVVPGAGDRPTGCLFSPRCKFANARCRAEQPGLTDFHKGRVRCFTPLEAGVPTEGAPGGAAA